MKKLILSIMLFLSTTALIKAQPIKWGSKVNGIQFGLQVEEGDYSFLYHVYVRATQKGITISNYNPELKFYLERGEQIYQLSPSLYRLQVSQIRLMPVNGGPVTIDIPIKKKEAVLLKTYVITKVLNNIVEPCSERNSRYNDITFFEARGINRDSALYTSNKVLLKYCESYNQEKELTEQNARFFNYLLKNPDATPTKVAIDIAKDTSQNYLLRGSAGRYLSDLNTQESRDVLYELCLHEYDPSLDRMLFFFYLTKDSRSIQLIETYYNSSNKSIRGQVAWAIGYFKAEEQMPLLLKLLDDEDRWIREAAAEALKNFNNDVARNALYKVLKDADLGVRTQAVYSLEVIGNKESLRYLAEYIESENPDNVGYINNAFKVAETLSGRKFDRDIKRLNEYIKTLDK